MAQAKKAAKRKRRKIALPVMGAAGVSLALAGGASAISRDTASPREITLGEEEIADISLATFYVFDKEADGILQDNVILAAACGGCRGCAVARCAVARCAVARCAFVRCAVARCAVARCAVVRCAVGCGVGCWGCGCSCCLSWGSCGIC